jgi:UDPglucose--hexose-1-phosphate uridylyltransferase
VTELRWHPLLEQWVTVAPARQDRTYHPVEAECPLCPTRAGARETEIPLPDYHIAVFENLFPSFTPDHGRCEVVCYTADHESSLGAQPISHIEDLVEVWQDRFAELSRVPEVQFVYIFENRGEEIGVTLHHPHGQIYAYPFVPATIQREVSAAARHHRATGRCLYCDLLREEVDGPRTVVKEAGWLAFVPSFARWPYEVHLAPVRHRADLLELTLDEVAGMARALKSLLLKYDRVFQKPLPYVMAMHQRAKRQSRRHCHLHVEFYPPNRTADKLKYLAGSELGAGAFIVDARAEETARRLRDL